MSSTETFVWFDSTNRTCYFFNWRQYCIECPTVYLIDLEFSEEKLSYYHFNLIVLIYIRGGVRHGPYRKFRRDNQLLLYGFYRNSFVWLFSLYLEYFWVYKSAKLNRAFLFTIVNRAHFHKPCRRWLERHRQLWYSNDWIL